MRDARDLDVFLARLREFADKRSARLPKSLLADLEQRRDRYYDDCINSIRSFLSSEALSCFEREIRFTPDRAAGKKARRSAGTSKRNNTNTVQSPLQAEEDRHDHDEHHRRAG